MSTHKSSKVPGAIQVGEARVRRVPLDLLKQAESKYKLWKKPISPLSEWVMPRKFQAVEVHCGRKRRSGSGSAGKYYWFCSLLPAGSHTVHSHMCTWTYTHTQMSIQPSTCGRRKTTIHNICSLNYSSALRCSRFSLFGSLPLRRTTWLLQIMPGPIWRKNSGARSQRFVWPACMCYGKSACWETSFSLHYWNSPRSKPPEHKKKS